MVSACKKKVVGFMPHLDWYAGLGKHSHTYKASPHLTYRALLTIFSSLSPCM